MPVRSQMSMSRNAARKMPKKEIQLDNISGQLARHDTDVMRRFDVLTELVDTFYEDWTTSQVVPPSRWERLVSWWEDKTSGNEAGEEV